MIICHSRKFVFIHLHKCAGTSITKALQDALSEEDLLISGGQTPHRDAKKQPSGSISSLRKHSSAQEVQQALGETKWNGYFKFTFVRHPLDRIVSFYEFLNRVLRNQSGPTVRKGFLNKLISPFGKEVADRKPDQAPWNWPGMQALLHTNDFSEFIRSDYLHREQGMNPLAQSIANDDGDLLVDFFGKVENMVDDWRTVCDRIGIEAPPLGCENKSRRQLNELREYWNDDDLKYILQKHRIDFELFGYSSLESSH